MAREADPGGHLLAAKGRRTSRAAIWIALAGVTMCGAATCWRWTSQKGTEKLTLEQARAALQHAASDDERARALSAIAVHVDGALRLLKDCATQAGTRSGSHAAAYINRIHEETRQ